MAAPPTGPGKQVITIITEMLDRVTGTARKVNKTVEDKKKRYQQVLTRGLAAGKQALIVKAADILDNSYYYHLAKPKKLRPFLLSKMKGFINKSEPHIKNEIVWKDLNKQYKLISKN